MEHRYFRVSFKCRPNCEVDGKEIFCFLSISFSSSHFKSLRETVLDSGKIIQYLIFMAASMFS